jgi:hypothetical protein
MKKNKFLKTYPQLWEPKVGDYIRIKMCLNTRKLISYSTEYDIGDTGTIARISNSPFFDNEKVYRIEFHDKDIEDDLSYVYFEEMELYYESE